MNEEAPAEAFVTVVALSELKPGKVKVVECAGRRIALGLAGDELFAFDDCCPHAASSFAAGRVIRDCLICPMHGARFDTRTGACVNAPYARLRRFATRITGEMVEVAIGSPL